MQVFLIYWLSDNFAHIYKLKLRLFLHSLDSDEGFWQHKLYWRRWLRWWWVVTRRSVRRLVAAHRTRTVW